MSEAIEYDVVVLYATTDGVNKDIVLMQVSNFFFSQVYTYFYLNFAFLIFMFLCIGGFCFGHFEGGLRLQWFQV